MRTTAAAPALPGWTFPEPPEYMPAVRPEPRQFTLSGVTMEVSVGEWGGPRVGHISGVVVSRRSACYLEGEFGLAPEGCLVGPSKAFIGAYRDLDLSREEDRAACVRQPGRSTSVEARDRLIDELSAALVGSGFGMALYVYDKPRALLRAAASERRYLERPRDGVRGRRAPLHDSGCARQPSHGVACEACYDAESVAISRVRLREAAVCLVPYHYPEGTPERATAGTLASAFPGTPDELLEVIATLHTAPQRPESPR